MTQYRCVEARARERPAVRLVAGDPYCVPADARGEDAVLPRGRALTAATHSGSGGESCDFAMSVARTGPSFAPELGVIMRDAGGSGYDTSGDGWPGARP